MIIPTRFMASPNILDTIVARKRLEVALLPSRIPTVEDLRAAVLARGGVRDFMGALRQPPRGAMALIMMDFWIKNFPSKARNIAGLLKQLRPQPPR